MLIVLPSPCWFSVRFRATAWWVAWTVGAALRWLASGWRPLVLLVVVVALAWWARSWLIAAGSDPGTGSPPLAELLTAGSALKILACTALLAAIAQAWRTRHRVVVLAFTNHAGNELDTDTGGLAANLLSELQRLNNLYITIDEALPAAGSDLGVTANVGGIGDTLKGAISTDSKIELGVLKLPAGALVGLVATLVQGPRLSGSVHRDAAGRLLLLAQLDGHGLNKSWQVAEDPDAPGLGNMIRQLAVRAFTDIAQPGSPVWEAVQCYSEGLRLYRRTVRSDHRRDSSLGRAERAFLKAQSHDKKFARCHYNLGIIYRDRKKFRSAEVAFRQALIENPALVEAAEALAEIHCRPGGSRAATIPQALRALGMQPESARSWRLLGLAQSTSDSDGDSHNGHSLATGSLEIAVAFAWRALCRDAIARRGLEPALNILEGCVRDATRIHNDNDNAHRAALLLREALSCRDSATL